MSPMLAGIRASMGAIQKPIRARDAASEPNDFASAAQKQDTIRPIDVKIYRGRFPILTARLLQSKEPTEMAAMQEP
jgi:hypothetical protein